MECDTEKNPCADNNNVVISILGKNLKNYIHEIKYKTYKRRKSRKFCFLFNTRMNGIILILGTYVAIFVIASIILVISVLRLQKVDESDQIHFNYKLSDHSNQKSVIPNGKHIDKIFSSKFFKEFVWPYRSSRKTFNCSALSYVKKFTYLASGWTKSVFSFQHNNENYALKTVNINGKDIQNCLEKSSLKICYEKASSKMYKEYILSQELAHPNIVKVLGWCVGDDNSLENVAVITELCVPVDTISLLQMTFQQRLRVAFELSKLVAYFSNSPLGSIAMNDFRKQQFVLCGNILKLTDLDDIGIDEPKCMNHQDCSQEELLKHLNLDNCTSSNNMQCRDHSCMGYNEQKNVKNMYTHFVSLFLPINVPPVLRQDVQTLLSSYVSSGWSSKIVFRHTEDLYLKFNRSNIKSY